MSTRDSWSMDSEHSWKLFSAALAGLPELAQEMRQQGLSGGDDLEEDAEGLRPELLRGVSEAWRADGDEQARGG